MIENESIAELPADGQRYRIKKATRQSRGPGVIKQVEAHHVFFDIIDDKIPREQARTGSYTLDSMLSFILAPTIWSFEVMSGPVISLAFENFGGGNVLKSFNELLERFSIEFMPDSLTNVVKIYERIGGATDAQIRYNHNLKTIKEDISTNDLSTKIKGYGAKKKETDILTGTGAPYASKTGTYTAVSGGDVTSKVGSTFNFSFTGTGFDYEGIITSTGGKIEFDIEGNKHTISTWSGPARVNVIRGLEHKSYNVTATFVGKDSNNAATNGSTLPTMTIKDGNAIFPYRAYVGEEQYAVVAVYESPNSTIYGERWAEDFEDERFTSVATLTEAIKAKIKDVPDLSMDIDYIELKKAGSNIHNFGIGDDIFILHERLNVDILARSVKVVDYPLSKGLKQPKITINNIRKNIKQVTLDTRRRSIEAQKAALAANNKAVAAQLIAEGAVKDLGETRAKLDRVTDENGNLTTQSRIMYMNSFVYADESGLWAVDPNDPARFVFVGAGGLDIQKGFMRMTRPDGYAVITDGILQNDFTITGCTPPFKSELLELTGRVYRTLSEVPVSLDFFSFRHDSRYLKIVAEIYTQTSGTIARLNVDPTGGQPPLATYTTTDIQNEAESFMFGVTITVDLGVPTGNRLGVYVRLSTGNASTYAYGRIISMRKEG